MGSGSGRRRRGRNERGWGLPRRREGREKWAIGRGRATTQVLDRSSVRPTDRRNEQQNTFLPPSLSRTPDLGLYCTNFCPRSLNRQSPIRFGRFSVLELHRTWRRNNQHKNCCNGNRGMDTMRSPSISPKVPLRGRENASSLRLGNSIPHSAALRLSPAPRETCKRQEGTNVR